MPYLTGTANSFNDLLTALQNACTANGYALNGNVLSKGTLFTEVTYVNQAYPALRVQGGTGQSGGVLSGRSDTQAAQMGIATTGGTLGANAFTFPVNYYIHILTNPDEVYLVVNLNGTQYQYVAFGQSSVGGLVGTGNWYAGSAPAQNQASGGVDIHNIGGFMQSGSINAGLFQGLSGYPGSQNGAVDHELDSATWNLGGAGAWPDVFALLSNTPSSWNGESVLVPVTVYAQRPSNLITCVAELGHARFVMLNNLQDQQIITLGSDKWKVYPWWMRSVGTNTGTGTYGHAFRYDGP